MDRREQLKRDIAHAVGQNDLGVMERALRSYVAAAGGLLVTRHRGDRRPASAARFAQVVARSTAEFEVSMGETFQQRGWAPRVYYGLHAYAPEIMDEMELMPPVSRQMIGAERDGIRDPGVDDPEDVPRDPARLARQFRHAPSVLEGEVEEAPPPAGPAVAYCPTEYGEGEEPCPTEPRFWLLMTNHGGSRSRVSVQRWDELGEDDRLKDLSPMNSVSFSHDGYMVWHAVTEPWDRDGMSTDPWAQGHGMWKDLQRLGDGMHFETVEKFGRAWGFDTETYASMTWDTTGRLRSSVPLPAVAYPGIGRLMFGVQGMTRLASALGAEYATEWFTQVVDWLDQHPVMSDVIGLSMSEVVTGIGRREEGTLTPDERQEWMETCYQASGGYPTDRPYEREKGLCPRERLRRRVTGTDRTWLYERQEAHDEPEMAWEYRGEADPGERTLVAEQVMKDAQRKLDRARVIRDLLVGEVDPRPMVEQCEELYTEGLLLDARPTKDGLWLRIPGVKFTTETAEQWAYDDTMRWMRHWEGQGFDIDYEERDVWCEECDGDGCNECPPAETEQVTAPAGKYVTPESLLFVPWDEGGGGTQFFSTPTCPGEDEGTWAGVSHKHWHPHGGYGQGVAPCWGEGTEDTEMNLTMATGTWRRGLRTYLQFIRGYLSQATAGYHPLALVSYPDMEGE